LDKKKLNEIKCLGTKQKKKTSKGIKAKQKVIKKIRTKINRDIKRKTQSIFKELARISRL
jgi:hypothetical protein